MHKLHNTRKFTVDENQIRTLIEVASWDTISDREKPSLKEEQAVEQPFDKDFECFICKCVVNNPKECDKCEKLGCNKCMNDWAKIKKTCAICRQSYKMKPPNKKVMGILNDTQFRCAKC
jgi:hypothetical protein